MGGGESLGVVNCRPYHSASAAACHQPGLGIVADEDNVVVDIGIILSEQSTAHMYDAILGPAAKYMKKVDLDVASALPSVSTFRLHG